jgi:Trk K+ transport system NAD-binding subunit
MIPASHGLTAPKDAAQDRAGHVIVCGLEGVALRVIEQLHQSGTPVVVLASEDRVRGARMVRSWGIDLIERSTSVGESLLEAGLIAARAVVCVEADELETLETALRARELHPTIRLVVEMANPAVAAGLAGISATGTVLDQATLAGPSFVEACLGRDAHTVVLGGTRFDVVELTCADSTPTDATFRSVFGDLAPVAAIPAPGDDLIVCPGRDHPVASGERVAVLGTPEDLRLAGIDPDHGHRPQRSISRSTRLQRRAADALAERNRSMLLVLTGLVALLAVATIVIRLAYVVPLTHAHLSLLSSAYFTIETVATVGFGDYSFAAQSPVMRVFAIIMIILGVALVSTAFALLTNILVSSRIERALGRREITGLADHVVVIGLGSVGITVVRGLVARGQRVVVIERDATNRYLDQARALGVPIVVADATQPQTLAMVHLGDATAVAVLTSADLTNIETGLAIRETLGDRWIEVPVVLRVFDRDLARLMERSFGFHHVRSTEAIAAPWFVGAALGLDVLSTFYVDHEPFLIGRVTVLADGGLAGLAMEDLSSKVRVIALSRSAHAGQLEHPPRRGTRFATGDAAYLLGPYEELLSVLQRNQRRSA